jgi:D-amino peptidase
MVESLNETFDCMFLIGYHSMSGTLCSVLDHTYSGRCVSELRINGRPSGEFVMSAMVAGYYGVPVALISGDYGVVQQAREVIPNIVGVEVKKGISRYSAGCIHPEVARKKIYSGAKEAIKLVRQKKITPFNAGSPIEIQLDLVNTGMADLSSMMPCAERTGPRTIKYIAKDPIEAYKFIVCAVTLASIT